MVKKQDMYKERKSSVGIYIAMLLLGGLVAAGFIFWPKTKGSIDVATSEETTTQTSPNEITAPTDNKKTAATGLDVAVEDALEGTTGTYSVAIKNLKTGETYYRDADRVYESASLYKLWVMIVTYEQLADGKLTETKVLADTIPNLNRAFGIASESAELTTGSISLTVKNALEQMITISHNYAAMLLSREIKLANVTTMLKRNGYASSSIGSPPKTTARDIATLMEDLYNGELGTEENTQIMLATLKRQQLNHKIPLYLPKGTVIAHKTGELDAVTHDAGIITGPNGDYILVVLTESTSPKGAEERIGRVSQAVYDYFAKE